MAQQGRHGRASSAGLPFTAGANMKLAFIIGAAAFVLIVCFVIAFTAFQDGLLSIGITSVVVAAVAALATTELASKEIAKRFAGKIAR
jgi:type III secretory pathway component EscS